MSFSSPIGSSGVSNRGYLGEGSSANEGRIAKAWNDIDGGQTLSEPRTARKRRSKGSSGFLLESNTGSTRQPRRSSLLFSNAPNLVRREHKRRNKYDEADGEVDRAGYTQVSAHNQPSKLRTVPVSQGAPDSVVMERRDHSEATKRDSDEISPISPEETNSAGNTSQDSNRARQIDHGDKDHQSDLSASRTDLDLESARLINLALNLNETRRRSVNLGRASPGLGTHERRSVSMMKPTSRWNSMDGVVGNGLRDQLGQAHRTSRHVSGIPNPKHQPRVRRDEDASTNMRSSVTSNIFSPSNQQPFDYHFSKATLARAEKAKVAFELAAEYRRLLQYLPPLRPEARPDLSAPSSDPSSPTLQSFRNPSSRVKSLSSVSKRDERSYNPLQCIRNRKVRTRERQTLDPAAEGWADVTKVKEWVDKVKKESNKGSFGDSHKGVLPPFPSAHLEPKHGQSASVTSLTQGDDTISGRWRRPRVDWQMTPEDLLADACWLEQDDHKELVEDRNGNKIFSPEINMEPPTSHGNRRFDRLKQLRQDLSGRNSLDVDDGFTKDSSTSLVAESRIHNFIREKHRRKHCQGVPVSEAEPEKESRRQRARRHTGEDRSVNSSDSDDWRQGPLGGRRSRHRKGNSSLEELDSALLEKHMLAMLQKEAEEIGAQQSNIPKAASYHVADGKEWLGNQSAHPGILDRLENQGEIVTRKNALPHQDSPESGKREPAGLSTDELNTTATNSPQGHTLRRSTESVRGLVPKFALSLSPPHTRRASPDREPQVPKEGLEHHEIEANDFATADGQATTPKEKLQPVDSASSTPEKQKRFSLTKILGSRRTNENGTEDDIPSNVKIRPINRDRHHADQSRIRGIFEGGGRIEEILRNEVSRLGGFIWKRDAPPDASATSSPTSPRDSEQLQSEDELPVVRNQLTNGITSSTTSMNNGGLSPVTTDVSPKYKLPTFTPLSGMDGAVQAPRGSKELGRLNPQHGDYAVFQNDRAMTSTNPSNLSLLASPDLSQTETRNSEFSDISSRRNSYSVRERSKSPGQLATNGVRTADSRLKRILGMAGSDVAVAELSNFNSANQQDTSRSAAQEVYRHWSISDSERPTIQGRWSPYEIARIRALLLSSGVKAQGIVRHAKRMEGLQPSVLDVESGVTSHKVRRDERHMITAQLLAKAIDHNTALLEESIQRLNNTIVPDLVKQISNVQDEISSKLTTEVGDHINDADGLSTELSTTHILTIKQLNDSIDLLMRRRRRRFRWIRRGGYVLLEWTLLGIMWWVWLIVVIIRLFRVTISGIFTGVRWILWL